MRHRQHGGWVAEGAGGIVSKAVARDCAADSLPLMHQ